MITTREKIRNALINEVHSYLEFILLQRGITANTLVDLVTKFLGLSPNRKPNTKHLLMKYLTKSLLKGDLKLENGRYSINKDEYLMVSSKKKEILEISKKLYGVSLSEVLWNGKRVLKKSKTPRKQRRVGKKGFNLKEFLRQSLDQKYIYDDEPESTVQDPKIAMLPRRKSNLTKTLFPTSGVAQFRKTPSQSIFEDIPNPGVYGNKGFIMEIYEFS